MDEQSQNSSDNDHWKFLLEAQRYSNTLALRQHLAHLSQQSGMIPYALPMGGFGIPHAGMYRVLPFPGFEQCQNPDGSQGSRMSFPSIPEHSMAHVPGQASNVSLSRPPSMPQLSAEVPVDLGVSPAKKSRCESPESGKGESLPECSSEYRTKSNSFSIKRDDPNHMEQQGLKPRSRSFGAKTGPQLVSDLLGWRRRGTHSSSGNSSRGSSPATKSGTSGVSNLSSYRDLASPVDPMSIDHATDMAGPSGASTHGLAHHLPKLDMPNRDCIEALPPFSMLKLLSSTTISSPGPEHTPSTHRILARTPPAYSSENSCDEPSNTGSFDDAISSVLNRTVYQKESGSPRPLAPHHSPLVHSFSTPSLNSACSTVAQQLPGPSYAHFVPSSSHLPDISSSRVAQPTFLVVAHPPNSSAMVSPSRSEGSGSSSGGSGGPGVSSSIPPPPAAIAEKCVVCDDRASGQHYGVMSCEGCKGFFRRTVQKNIEYRCHGGGQCPVNRNTRNRCQSCRFTKCMRAGMSRESVRQDRNRKRKVHSEQDEEELRQTARMQQVISTVVEAQDETYNFQPGNDQTVDLAEYIRRHLLQDSPCGLNQVVEFCRRIPGFEQLDPHDRDILLRYGCIEIWILRCAFSLCGRQVSIRRETEMSGDVGLSSLVDCVCRLRDALNSLQVFWQEIALLSAVSFMCNTRPGLQNPAAVESLQEPLLEGLEVQVRLRRPVADADNAVQHSPKNVSFRLLTKLYDVRVVVAKDLENFAFAPPCSS